MNETPRPSLYQETDAETLATLRALIGGATYAAIATLSPDGGHPMCSRVGMSTLSDGTPIIFVSSLSAHTPALLADPRCSLLVGHVEKGDPLVNRRVTLVCRAAPIPHNDTRYAEARERYLAAHPKAGLYADFTDFMYLALTPSRAHYVAGFGRAHLIEGATLLGKM